MHQRFHRPSRQITGRHHGWDGLRLSLSFGMTLTFAISLLLGVTLVQRPAWSDDPKPEAQYRKGILIRFEGVITPLLEQYTYRKLDLAEREGADLVIVEIDSPGGFLDASVKIADRLRDIRWAHTVAFVPREAISGGAIVALGCDDIIMAPNARIGDAGPIEQGADFQFRHVPEKIRSYVARQVRDLAEAKGRPPAIAEAMVDMDLVVYQVSNAKTGEETFMTDQELASDKNRDEWEKGKPIIESRKKHFLTVNGKRAMELQLGQGIAETRHDLEKRYHLETRLIVLEPTIVDMAVTILNSPWVTGALFVIGLIALYFEFSAPGIGMGALTAGLCFLLFFWSRFLGGTAGWLEVVLFLAGVGFLAMELFVIPGFGIAGFSGLVLIFLSILMAGQEFLIPRTSQQMATSLKSLLVLSSSGIIFVAAAMVLSHYFKMLPVVRWLVLETPTVEPVSDAKGGKGASTTSSRHRFPVQVGDWGIAESPLRPAGKAIFQQHYVDVVTDGSYVDAGRQIRVIEISGNRVVVREVPEETTGQD